jgi:glycosyltransferase involved in cell wall biosynthesis
MNHKDTETLKHKRFSPLISVIVPVYNVSAFLPQCLNSLIAQTYSNLEIILVDDGSTDDSGSICDRYSKRHSGFSVIHQQNMGLSGARNTGLSHALGDYLIFIDSDDVIATDCIEYSVSAISATHADMVLFRYKLIDETDGTLHAPHIESNFPNNTVSGVDACSLLFERRFENYTWRQLTKTSIYRDNSILFPMHRAFEDRYTTYKVLFFSKSVAFLSEQLYFYRQRKDSIVHARNSQYLLDDLSALQERSSFIDVHAPALHDQCKGNTYSSYIGIYRASLVCHDSRSNVKRIHDLIYNDVHFSSIVSLPLRSVEKRIQLLLIKTRAMILVRPLVDLLRKWTGHSF